MHTATAVCVGLAASQRVHSTPTLTEDLSPVEAHTLQFKRQNGHSRFLAFWTNDTQNIKRAFISVYIKPDERGHNASGHTEKVLADIDRMLDSLQPPYELIVAGDFNIHSRLWASTNMAEDVNDPDHQCMPH